MFNYKYIVNGNKVICLSTFAGKAVRGIAKCAPGDEFDVEKGKDLATARCAAKVAKRRYNRAMKKLEEAKIQAYAANDYLDKMLYYFQDARYALEEAEDAVDYCKENL